MDLIDQKIIERLENDPRCSVSQIARSIRQSQQVVDFRMKRLQKNKVISRFATIINLHRLGYEHLRIFFQFNAKEITNEEIFTYLQHQKNIYWTARIGGKYDLIVVLIIHTFRDYDVFMNDFNARFPGLVKDVTGCQVLQHTLYRHKNFTNVHESIQYGSGEQHHEIDVLDHKILSTIKNDCRFSALSLGKSLNVSYKTIQNRIKNLEQEQVIIGYRLFFKDITQKAFILLLSFKNYSRHDEEKLLAYCAEEECITQTLRLFGRWHLFLHIRIEDNENLQETLIRIRDKYRIIDDYEIIPVFEDILINLLPI